MANFAGKLHDVYNYGALRLFLLNPRDKKSFDHFFEICFYSTVGYLRYLKAKGLTIELLDANVQKSLMDITYDILGDFLQTDNNCPFHIIFDYFKRHNITDFNSIDPNKLYDHFTILLRGFIRKTLYKNRKERFPQVANLERRINDIIKGNKFYIFKQNSESAEFVCLSINKEKLRRECQPLVLTELLGIVYSTFSNGSTNNRVDWLNNIFAELEMATEFQNFIQKYDLIRAIVYVNDDFVELDGSSFSAFPQPDTMNLRREIDEKRLKSQEHSHEIIKNYIDKGRISYQEGELFCAAVRRYLTDFAFDGQTDKIPAYFFEIFPGYSQEKYLKKYKYVFETIINTAREDFVKRLKNIL